MNCPQCGGGDVLTAQYATLDEQTGYSDAGCLYECRSCGAVSTEQEMARENEEVQP